LSFIWEKDCYYNERGNVECNYSPANLLYKPSKGYIFCNILLIGESRAGKSSFINRMFNKLVAYEAGQYESSTQEITYYEFGLPDIQEEKDGNKLIKNGYGLIRILDTPGLVLTKDLNASTKIIDKLDNFISRIANYYRYNKNDGKKQVRSCVCFNLSNIEDEELSEEMANRTLGMPFEVFDLGQKSQYYKRLLPKGCYIPLAASFYKTTADEENE